MPHFYNRLCGADAVRMLGPNLKYPPWPTGRRTLSLKLSGKREEGRGKRYSVRYFAKYSIRYVVRCLVRYVVRYFVGYFIRYFVRY